MFRLEVWELDRGIIMEKYDLVRVLESETFPMLEGAIGIITKVYEDIDNLKVYQLIFVGKKHNELAYKLGALFYDHELEGI